MQVYKNARYLLFATILFAASCGEDKTESTEEEKTTTTTPSVPAPAVIVPAVVNEYPHDKAAFTEGLQFVNGYLYESVGQYKKSDIRKTDLKTGKVLQQQKLGAQYFGEGLTVLNGKIYQLTYKEKKGFIYDFATLKQTGEFAINTGEGWGLTNDGTNLIYSDGSSTLYFIDPKEFKEVKRLTVTDNYGRVSNINELEFIKGHIYANQWETEFILKIDPGTGHVVATADLTNLRSQAGIPSNREAVSEASPEVLNGIAYDEKNNRIFVTGKNWPKLLEVKLDN